MYNITCHLLESLISYLIYLFLELHLILDSYLHHGLYLILDSLSKGSILHIFLLQDDPIIINNLHDFIIGSLRKAV